jgi:hypothetical protein
MTSGLTIVDPARFIFEAALTKVGAFPDHAVE